MSSDSNDDASEQDAPVKVTCTNGHDVPLRGGVHPMRRCPKCGADAKPDRPIPIRPAHQEEPPFDPKEERKRQQARIIELDIVDPKDPHSTVSKHQTTTMETELSKLADRSKKK